jgi:hypothetical protein
MNSFALPINCMATCAAFQRIGTFIAEALDLPAIDEKRSPRWAEKSGLRIKLSVYGLSAATASDRSAKGLSFRMR